MPILNESVATTDSLKKDKIYTCMLIFFPEFYYIYLYLFVVYFQKICIQTRAYATKKVGVSLWGMDTISGEGGGGGEGAVPVSINFVPF